MCEQPSNTIILWDVLFSRFLTQDVTMGLDLLCGMRSLRMGSYGYVHVQRWGWIKANMLYCMDHAETTAHKQEIEQRWQRALKSLGPYSPKLDYDYISTVLQKDMLSGIFIFVYHSDCDGDWSCDEAKQMLDAFQILRPYLSQVEELSCEVDDDSGKYYLEDLFSYAWNKKMDIQLA